VKHSFEYYAPNRKRYKVEGVGQEFFGGVRLDVYLNRPRTLPEILNRTVQRDPKHEAFVYENERISYGELAQSVDNLAFQWKEEYGLRPGDRAMMFLRNTPEFVASFFAASQMGVISVPSNTRLKAPEIEYLLKDSDPSILVLEPELWERVLEVKDRAPSLKAIFITGLDKVSGATLLSDLISRAAPQKIQNPATEEDINSILYTSGTTGNPKGAMLCHRNFIANSMTAQALCRLSSQDKLLIMAPMFHVTALNSQLVKIVHAGATGVLMRAFKTEEILDMIEREHITEMTGVPAMYSMILQSPTLARRDLSTLKYCGYGGAPAPVEVIKTLKEKFPTWRLRNVYGLTEDSSWVTMLPHDQTTIRPDSTGLPVPVVRLKIVNDRSEEVPQGEVGEILIQGPNIFKGYWRKPEATAESLKYGWFYTGDLGRFDKEGYLYLVDRKKEMVIRGGENIYCIEVENVLYQHPKVVEAAVTGVPDPILGELVKAVCVLKKGQKASELEIQEFCKKYLADYKVPKIVCFIDELPRNPAGKVIKKAL
jgi:acyl-CoA synthetase (AMP-forming)/AMP-acid ligase II